MTKADEGLEERVTPFRPALHKAERKNGELEMEEETGSLWAWEQSMGLGVPGKYPAVALGHMA